MISSGKMNTGLFVAERGESIGMTWREMKYPSEAGLRRLKEEISDILAKKYRQIIISDHIEVRRCFELPDGTICHPAVMIGEKFDDLVIEYSEDLDRMKVYDSDDGYLYPPDAFESKEALFDAILSEIEG